MNLGIWSLPIMRHCRNYGPVAATLSNLGGSGLLSRRHNAVQTPDRGHPTLLLNVHTCRESSAERQEAVKRYVPHGETAWRHLRNVMGSASARVASLNGATDVAFESV
jgi:hypothetical protein